MKAAILEGYRKGGRELIVKDIPVPEIGAHEILVKIKTAGVNPLDNMIVRGDVKLIVPYRFPLVMGNEFVGTVTKRGKAATRFSVGERVYGRMPLGKIGAFAEYAAVDQAAVARVPAYLSDAEAACVPLTALTAIQAFALIQPKPGQSVFISGGTGSLGAMAIPVAKRLGLTVLTNGSGDEEARVRALGADVFVDYRKQDFADVISDVDFVLDTLGDRALPKEFQVLRQGGRLVSLRGVPNAEFAVRNGMGAMHRLLFRFAGRKYDAMAAKRNQNYYFVFVHEDGAGLEKLSEMFADKQIEASVDEVYCLDDVNKALQKVAAGRSKGKTVLKISD